MTHDRIREAIVAQVPADAAREHHARLARILEATPRLGSRSRSRPTFMERRRQGSGPPITPNARPSRPSQSWRSPKPPGCFSSLATRSRPRRPRLAGCANAWPRPPSGQVTPRRLLVRCPSRRGGARRRSSDGRSRARGGRAALIATGCIDESVLLSRRVLATRQEECLTRYWARSSGSSCFALALSTFLTRSKLADPGISHPRTGFDSTRFAPSPEGLPWSTRSRRCTSRRGISSMPLPLGRPPSHRPRSCWSKASSGAARGSRERKREARALRDRPDSLRGEWRRRRVCSLPDHVRHQRMRGSGPWQERAPATRGGILRETGGRSPLAGQREACSLVYSLVSIWVIFGRLKSHDAASGRLNERRGDPLRW